jgi:hypothetical protein
MMDKFTQIILTLSMMKVEESLTRNHFRGATPFKVQVKFYIPLFEGQIDAYALEKWLNLLEGFTPSKISSTEKISPSCSLNSFSLLELGGKVTRRGTPHMNLHHS